MHTRNYSIDDHLRLVFIRPDVQARPRNARQPAPVDRQRFGRIAVAVEVKGIGRQQRGVAPVQRGAGPITLPRGRWESSVYEKRAAPRKGGFSHSGGAYS